MALETYDVLEKGTVAEGRDPLSVELVADAETTTEDIEARVSAALPEGSFSVEAVFDPAADRYFFVDFPDIDPHGQEREVFAFARDLRQATETAEANPVLPDSLYGAHHVADGNESLFSFCETLKDIFHCIELLLFLKPFISFLGIHGLLNINLFG